MEKMCAITGMLIGSSLGGWLGGMVGIWSMMFFSAIGAGVGFYLGRKLASDFLD